MKKFTVISDFDNTISDKDFYWIVIDDFIGQSGKDFYAEWKKVKKIGTEFLNEVFSMHQFTSEEHDQALATVGLDKDLGQLVHLVESAGGDFHILSAGFDYYIHEVLKREGMSHLSVHTNKGVFDKGYFRMEPAEADPFYSPIYGIDKEKVALHYKSQCEKLIFIGDSEPDFWAARHADVVFAKEELARIMDEHSLPYHRYANFSDICSRFNKII